MNLEILTPGKKIYSGQVTLVKVPGSMGSFEILNSHAPIISPLEKGTIKIITKDKQEQFFDI
jgi:F-type H+-transporting ATPase subunit epsilon